MIDSTQPCGAIPMELEDQAVLTLKDMGGPNIKAKDLVDKLMRRSLTKMSAQLAISRAIDKGKIKLNNDWSMSLKESN